jgi:uncharacterized protein YndB with AHSA1/START domain
MEPAKSGDRNSSGPAFAVVETRVEVPIEAPAGRVWQAVVEETATWWPADFYAGENTTQVRVEAWAGGRIFEQGPGGAGLLWFTVLAVSPGKHLDLAGHLIPHFGGPAISHVRWAVESRGDASAVVVSDSTWGGVAGGSLDSIVAGWEHLFRDGLKKYLEAK